MGGMGGMDSVYVGVCFLCMDGGGLWVLCVGGCVGGVGLCDLWVYRICG